MAFTRLQIMSLALNALGKKSINDISQAGEFGDALDRSFDFVLQACLSNQDWRFATRIQLLNVLPDAPLSPQWKYKLQLPADYIAAIRSYPPVDFEIYEDKIFSNENNFTLEYRYNVPVGLLPTWFVRYFVYDLAEHLTIAVPLKQEYANLLREKKYEAFDIALSTNYRTRPSSSGIINYDILAARGGWSGDSEIPIL